MKIAIVGQFIPSWYGCMSEWVANGFIANGHQIEKYDRKDIILFPDLYDLIVHVDCSEDYSRNICTCKKSIKACWLMDSHMPSGIERSVNIAKKCDLVFSSNYEAGVKILEKFGIKSYLLPITYDSTLVKESKLDLYDVAMIAHPNSPERIKLWEMLHTNYKTFTGKAETKEDYQKIMGGVKIVINGPTEPWDMILNNRLFEGLSYKKLVLQKVLKTSLIEKMGFKHGKDFIYWKDLKDLRKKIDYFLLNRCEAEVMAENGYRKVQRWSIKNQCHVIENIVLNNFYEKFNN